MELPPNMSLPFPWFEMPSPFGDDGERVLMLEPPSAQAGELRAQLLDDSYGRPYVIDNGEWRYLQFDRRLVQSAMRLAAPNALEVRYTKMMMAFMLFQPRPRRMVLIGLGGGSLVKFCHHRLPAAHLTVVENNRDVISLRDAFRVPPDGPNLQVLEADGATYIEAAGKGIDVLLVDAFDKEGYAPALASPEFLERARCKLAGSGVLVINLAGQEERYADLIAATLQVFDDQVVVVPLREDDNQVLFAFRDPRFEPNWRCLANLARELRARYGLDFPALLQAIERSARQGRARHEAGCGR